MAVDFFDALAKTPRDWFLDDEQMVRRRGPSGLQCPISALRDQPMALAHEVATTLGLGFAERMGIIYAADWSPIDPADADLFDDADELRIIRAAILRACDLHDDDDGA